MGRHPPEQPIPDLFSTATVRDVFTAASETKYPDSDARKRTATAHLAQAFA